MNQKSNSCNVRNQIVEISFIESLLYKNYYKCKRLYTQSNQLNSLKKCEENLNQIFTKYSTNIDNLRSINQVCLIKCSDNLLVPSEELTCYDKCEENYYQKLVLMKKNLFDELNKKIS